MSPIGSIFGDVVLKITEGWRMARTPAGEFIAPPDRSSNLDWINAMVPGTVAGTLVAAGLWSDDNSDALENSDYWYFTRISGHGPRVLRCSGLATVAEVWVNGVLTLTSDNMYLRHDVSLNLDGHSEIAICFRALSKLLAKPIKRARWKSRLVHPATLRGVRASLIGHMPSWCPPIPVIGPWRPIELVTPGRWEASAFSVQSRVDGPDGVVRARIDIGATAPGTLELECAGLSAPFTFESNRGVSELRIPDVERWWPHTHGNPRLYALFMKLDGVSHEVGRVGFRVVECDRGADGLGFGLRVNGVEIFCRGSIWTTPDIVTVPGDRETYEPLLTLMRDANMNMVRIGGTFVYETPAFHEVCDELGLLVWQDLMFANLDYPFSDHAFKMSVEREVRQILEDTQSSPSLVVVCGGSEVFQQAAMMGLPPATLGSSWFETSLPALVETERQDVIVAPNTPYGGRLPFEPGAGTSHYYGVSAYMRPLEDARMANVRFATECLGFANPGDDDPQFESREAKFVQPCWGERTPFDAGAAWFFEDVRNHYIEHLYGISGEKALEEGAGRYLALSRAVNVELMESVIAEFRRVGSPTKGALTWFLKDVWRGPGWGNIDCSGRPKPVYSALKRAFRPIQVILSDEGLNGLFVHLLNETTDVIEASLSLVCLADGRGKVMQSEFDVSLGRREARLVAASEIWGAFFDTTYAYRFGPPSHDVTVATLRDRGTGELLAQHFHFPLGRGVERHDVGLVAELISREGVHELTLCCQRLAQSIQIISPGFQSDDNWFHLAPGVPRKLRLVAEGTGEFPPRGSVIALNGINPVEFGSPS